MISVCMLLLEYIYIYIYTHVNRNIVIPKEIEQWFGIILVACYFSNLGVTK